VVHSEEPLAAAESVASVGTGAGGFFSAMRSSPSGPGKSRLVASGSAQNVLEQSFAALLIGSSGAGGGVQTEARFAY